MRRLLLSALIAVPMVHAQIAGGVFVCSNCAEEPTQLTNKVSLLTQIQKQLQQITIALNTYNQIMIAGRLLSHMQWSSAQQDLMNLSSIVQVGSGLAFSLAALDAQFTRSYPGCIQRTDRRYAGFGIPISECKDPKQKAAHHKPEEGLGNDSQEGWCAVFLSLRIAASCRLSGHA